MTRKYLVVNSIVFIISLFLVIRYSNLPLLTGDPLSRFLFYSDNSYKSDAFSISASIFAAYVFFIVNDFFPKLSESKDYKKRTRPLVIKILSNISNIFRNIGSQTEGEIKFPVANWDEDFMSSLKTADDNENVQFIDIDAESKVFKRYKYGGVGNKPVESSMKHFLLEDLKSTLTSIDRLRRIAMIRNHAIDGAIDKLETEIQQNIDRINLVGDCEKGSAIIFLMLKEIYKQSENLIKLFYDEYGGDEKLTCDIWNNKHYKKQADKITIDEVIGK